MKRNGARSGGAYLAAGKAAHWNNHPEILSLELEADSGCQEHRGCSCRALKLSSRARSKESKNRAKIYF